MYLVCSGVTRECKALCGEPEMAVVITIKTMNHTHALSEGNAL